MREEKGLKASLNKGLRRIFGPKAEKAIKRLNELANVRASLIALMPIIIGVSKTKVEEKGGTCSTHISSKKYLKKFLLNSVTVVYSGVDCEAKQWIFLSTAWIYILCLAELSKDIPINIKYKEKKLKKLILTKSPQYDTHLTRSSNQTYQLAKKQDFKEFKLHGIGAFASR